MEDLDRTIKEESRLLDPLETLTEQAVEVVISEELLAPRLLEIQVVEQAALAILVVALPQLLL